MLEHLCIFAFSPFWGGSICQRYSFDKTESPSKHLTGLEDCWGDWSDSARSLKSNLFLSDSSCDSTERSMQHICYFSARWREPIPLVFPQETHLIVEGCPIWWTACFHRAPGRASRDQVTSCEEPGARPEQTPLPFVAVVMGTVGHKHNYAILASTGLTSFVQIY